MKIYKNFDLTNYNSYSVQSTCEEAYFPDSENDIVDFFKNNNENFKVEYIAKQKEDYENFRKKFLKRGKTKAYISLKTYRF